MSPCLVVASVSHSVEVALLGLVGTAVGVLVVSMIGLRPMTSLRRRRLLKGDQYVATHVPGGPIDVAELDRERHVDFAMRHSEPLEGDIGSKRIYNLKFDVHYFRQPVVKLYGSFLVVNYGPARRAVIPYSDVARLTTAPLKTYRKDKTAVRYLPEK